MQDANIELPTAGENTACIDFRIASKAGDRGLIIRDPLASLYTCPVCKGEYLLFLGFWCSNCLGTGKVLSR